MFTGIVRRRGRVVELRQGAGGVHRLRIDAAGWNHGCGEGDSIAVNGCCLTLISGDSVGGLEFDVIPETLRCTTLGGLKPGVHVNLEAPATPATMLSGHIMQGHVDGVGSAARQPASGAEVVVRIHPPLALMPYLAPKGSVSVDGVSLTISRVGEGWFEVALIPATLEQTTLGDIGDEPVAVNVETDCLVKAVVHYLERCGSAR